MAHLKQIGLVSTIVKKVVDLKPKYNFTKRYEADLEALLGKSWRQRIIAVTADPVFTHTRFLQIWLISNFNFSLPFNILVLLPLFSSIRSYDNYNMLVRRRNIL